MRACTFFIGTILVCVGARRPLIARHLGIKRQFLIAQCMVSGNTIRVKPNNYFKKTYLKDDFFALYDTKYNLSVLPKSIVTIPFVLSVISIVWQSGLRYYIDEMDVDLWRSIQIIKEIYKSFYPQVTWSGELIPLKLVDNSFRETVSNQNSNIAQLFSHGLDSVCTSLMHQEKKQLLLTYWGFSHEIPLDNDDCWRATYSQCSRYAERYGHNNAFVHSNFRIFINYKILHKRYGSMRYWYEHCQEALSQVALAAPILVLEKIAKLYIPSSRTKEYPYPWGGHPLIDNNICFAQVCVEHDGFSLTRQEKIEHVAHICTKNKQSIPDLIVCRKEENHNCLRCEKCLQTMTGLLAAGIELPSCGFEATIDHVISRVKDAVNNQSLQLSHIFAWHWKNIQRYLMSNKCLEKKINKSNLDTQDYLSWLLTVNFDSLHSDFPRHEPIDEKLFDQYL